MLRTSIYHESNTFDAASTITRLNSPRVESHRPPSLANLLPCYPDILARKRRTMDAGGSEFVVHCLRALDDEDEIVSYPGV